MEDWLNENIPGYADLSADEKEALNHFSILWSFFENYVLNTNASVGSIEQKVAEWENDGRIETQSFLNHKDYFVQRYIENGSTNYRFQHLNLRNNDNPQRVQDVLLGNLNDAASILTVLLTIVFRYRNNLFHGLKWEYGIEGQLSNFNQANLLLKKTIKLL